MRTAVRNQQPLARNAVPVAAAAANFATTAAPKETKKRASSTTKTAKAGASKANAAAAAAVADATTKKAGAKPKAPKKEKLKPWQARGTDGKLLPLPSASKPTLRSSFLIYMSERVAQLKGEPQYQKTSPKTGAQVVDIVKMAKAVGAEWAQLPPHLKSRYEAQHEQEKEEYERALAEWKAALSPEDIKRQNAYIASQKKKGIKGTAFLRDPAKPKRPNSAFFEFLNDLRASEAVIPNITEFSKRGGERWKQMSAEQKAPYEQRALQALEQYKRDLELYNSTRPAEL
ncbi:putative Non-histone chromosomal protein 6B (putative) [Pseudozyma hubeiensis]|nr:putative Non-histone chromosomal protein 6B (putative) [Pseudozyma hubeiensis]